MTAAISYEVDDLRILAGLEERHFWFRARRRIIIDALRRWFPDAGSYLEAGCGTGYNVRGIARAFPQMRIVASDPLASESSPFLQMDACRLPFENEFDVIGAYDVIEHIRDDAAALGQFRKACRRGGGILLTVPQHPWLWSAADRYAHHHRRYTARGLKQLVEDAGFRVIGTTSFHTLNLPLFLLNNRVLQATGRSPAVAMPPPGVNWILERSMDIERILIRSGIHLPVGVSLLLAGRLED